MSIEKILRCALCTEKFKTIFTRSIHESLVHNYNRDDNDLCEVCNQDTIMYFKKGTRIFFKCSNGCDLNNE